VGVDQSQNGDSISRKARTASEEAASLGALLEVLIEMDDNDEVRADGGHPPNFESTPIVSTG
jgi:hypothetical protein